MRRSRILSRALRLAAVATAGAAFAGAAEAAVTVTKAGERTTMRVTVDDLALRSVTVDGRNFVAPSLVGIDARYAAVTHDVGAPALPVVRFYAEGEVEVTVDGSLAAASGALKKGQLVAPAQPSLVKLPGAAAPLAFDGSAYARTSLDQPAYEIEDAGSIDGVRRKLVTLRPLAYAPATGTWRLTRAFTVTIAASEKPAHFAAEREIFAFVVGQRFKDSPSLARYEALKEEQGYLVERIDVTSADTPETIRARLKALYARQDAKLAHALLVGDAADVPGKESTIISGVTDHYYRAIDTDDYASDINGPDIGVGRVSVQSEAQLEAVLAKFTRYVGGAFSEEGWLDEVAFLATDDRYEVAEGSHNYVINTYTKAAGYRGVFPHDPEAGGDQLYAITHRVSDQKVHEVMGMGRTIINYSGHGSTTSWAGPNVSQADVRALSDPNALPFVIGNACITGDYRVSESFGETWQRHPAGAITYWGSMDSSYWDEDDILERAMFDGIYRDGKASFADITGYALSENWRHYNGQGRSAYYWETYVLFGDPSLTLRTTKTRAVIVDGPTALPIGVSSVSYVVRDAQGPVKGARVALAAERTPSLKLAGVTDADGRVTFDLSAAARDVRTFHLDVSGANVRRAASELRIVPADTPYLALATFTAAGREDGALYVGETPAIGFTVQNLGQRPTAGAKVEIVAVEGPADATGTTLRLPALAARAAHTVDGTELAIKVREDAQSGAAVRVDLKWTTDEGQTAIVPVSLRVKRAQVEVKAVDFGASGDEGGIRPGESGDLFLTLVNVGNEAVRAGELALEAGACVDAVQGDVSGLELAPGATARIAAPARVTVSGACRNGQTAELRVAGHYDSVAAHPSLAARTSFPVGVVVTRSRELTGLSVAIPDAGDAVEQAIDAQMTGVVKDVGVHVKITHSYVGDLVVKLVHPDGTEVVLSENDGGSNDGIDQTFGLGGTPVQGLAALAGKSASGTWKLVVQDTASQDVGTLDAVTLTVKGYLE